jgi:signal transduction histidine kinase
VVVLAARDVTHERQMERDLRESEERLARALAAVGADVWEYRVGTGKLVLSEPRPPGGGREPSGAHALLRPEDRTRLKELLEEHVGAGAEVVEAELQARLPEGAVRWIRLRGGVSERAPDGRPLRYTGTVRDVTEANELRARLARADRLASLGTLAAGIAHEVNNPVAYVAANLGFVREELGRTEEGAPARSTSEELRQAIDEAISGAARVRDIVAGLKQFSTGAERGPGPVDVRAELEAALGMTRHEVAQRARLVVELPAALPAVVAGPAELGQVFVNLIVNAAHAIPEGRPLENAVEVAARAEAGRVVVEVKDTGVGIPPEVLPRIFDPFFTTKPIGTGTGLGLSICHGIVNSAGGTIEAESAPGHGSTFRVVLPAAAAAPPVAAGPAPGAAARARILVVDDEPLVGKALARLLSGQHEVVVTTSAPEALARLAGGERFDLVLCDLMMPEMSGMELEARIASAAPAMVGRMVFMTGGAFTPAARAFLAGGRPHLEKPVEPGALRELVARRIAEGRES